MDTSILLLGASCLMIGLLLGWVLEWRIDAAHWKLQVAHLQRRELLQWAEAEQEIAAAQREADRRMAEQKQQLETQLVQVRLQAAEQVAAAHARIEVILGSTAP